jgi:class 3 adenylate cyclase
MNELAAPLRPRAAVSRVLVVDDDADMASYLGHLLAGQGLSVHTLSNGDAALRYLRSTPPDLVLLDVVLPGASGFEICERLKRDPITALIPVVLVTSLEDHESRVHGIEAGADDFLSKPVKREELLARVKTLLRLHDTRRELEERRLAAEIERKEAIRKAFSRYISPRIAERIMQGVRPDGSPFKGEPERADVVALFADLRGFTTITETIEVQTVVGMLNEYFAAVTEAAYKNEGTIFNMAGDCLLVGFNVPFAQADAPKRAWRTAQDMAERFAPISAAWRAKYGVETGIGLGMCSGEAIIGNIGSPHFMSHTVIGDTVNTAARLVQMAKAGELLLSGRAYEALRGIVPAERVEPRGEIPLRGKLSPTMVYSVRL